jgi:hypothetical protein
LETRQWFLLCSHFFDGAESCRSVCVVCCMT